MQSNIDPATILNDSKIIIRYISLVVAVVVDLIQPIHSNLYIAIIQNHIRRQTGKYKVDSSGCRIGLWIGDHAIGNCHGCLFRQSTVCCNDTIRSIGYTGEHIPCIICACYNLTADNRIATVQVNVDWLILHIIWQ